MKTIKLLTLIAAVSMMMFSCSKEETNLSLDALKEAVNESESFILEESDFTISGRESLNGVYDDMYTEGVMEYTRNGVVLATVEFGNGTDANQARLIRNDVVTDIALDRPGDGQNHACFRFVYPITYIMPDGSEITGESKEEIHQAFHEWYEAHPDVAQRPELQFPVEIKFRHRDDLVTIENYQQLHRAYASCDDRPDWDGHCHRRFIKRIVEPLVRTDDCGREPVSGVIKFFKCRTHEWVATIDFGDGECDDLAVKITADGATVIVISEWFD